MSIHRINYYNPQGSYVTTFFTFFRLEYFRTENDYGSMYIDLPPDVSPKMFDIDGRFEIFRAHNGINFANEMQTQWLVRLVRDKTDEQGKRFTHVLAYDANHIIERRIVAYKSESAQAKKTNVNADNLMKAIMRENFGVLATDPERNLSNYISIPSDNRASIAPRMSRSFAYQKVLPLLQDICEDAKASNFYMAFDMTPITNSRFRFDIYYGTRGVNRGKYSKNPLVFSLENGALSYASYARDFTQERNFIYAGGAGEAESRVLKTSRDNKAIGLSPFNRNEDFISYTDKDPNAVQAAARSRLREAANKRAINGHVQQNPSCLFGVHYGFGDIVVVNYAGVSIDVHLDSVRISVGEDQTEDIAINSRNLPDSDY